MPQPFVQVDAFTDEPFAGNPAAVCVLSAPRDADWVQKVAGALAPFWAERFGKAELFARQVSARGGNVRVALSGDRVRLSGQAVTVLRGELVAE